MPFYYTPYIIFPLLSALTNGALAIYSWKRRHIPAARWLFWIMIGLSGWSLSYALNIAATELWLKDLFFKTGTSFVCLVTFSTIPTVLSVTNTAEEGISRLKLVFLGAIPFTSIILVWTNNWLGLMRHSYSLVKFDNLILFGYMDGPYFRFHGFYSYLIDLLLILICVLGIFKRGTKRQFSLVLIIVATIIPLGIDMLGFSPVKEISLTTSSLFITGLLYWLAVFQHYMLDLVPIARSALFEDMIEPVLVVDPKGRLAAINHAAQRLLKLHSSTVGLTLDKLFPPDAPMHGLVKTKHNSILYDSGTSCWWHISRTEVLREKQFQGYLLVLRDITQLHQFQEELKENEQRLSSALAAEQKTRTLQERFLDMISHEYRTPLAIIQTNIDIIRLKEQKAGRTTSGSLTKMQQAVERLIDIFESTRRHEGLERRTLDPIFESIELHPYLNEMLCTARNMWGERIVYFTDLPPRHRLCADGRLLLTVLLNLLDNAVKYSPSGAPVMFRVSVTDGWLKFTVSNRTLTPLPADTEPLFKKYIRGPNIAGTSGTGLGLYLARGIVEQNGGTLGLTVDKHGDIVAIIQLPHKIDMETLHAH